MTASNATQTQAKKATAKPSPNSALLPGFLHAPSWREAATFAERLKALRAKGLQSGENSFHKELAEKRRETWLSQQSFSETELFENRLAVDDLSEEEFMQLLGQSAEPAEEQAVAPPEWVETFLAAFAQFPAGDDLPLPEKLRETKTAGFLNAAAPLLQQGMAQLQREVDILAEDNPGLPFDPAKAVEILFAGLPERIAVMLSRTLVLEMHIARLQGQLAGETPEECFENFTERLRRPEAALNIFADYPVLARQIVIAVEHWVNFSREFLSHLIADWQDIRATFAAGSDPGKLTTVSGGEGDSHREGRSVMIATFESGVKIVYKPRSLKVDVHFQELLAWLNERGDHPPFYILQILERPRHGWVEFVSAADCRSPEEVDRFYRRQGGYLALLYALQSSDFHLENLIAAGEHPVLIDLETLLLPQFGHSDAGGALQLAGEDLFNNSVMRVMLLPHRLYANEESVGVENSGLGGAPGQLSPFAVPDWEGTATDAMHIVRRRLEMKGSRNRPRLNGEEIDLLDYREALINGFSAIYRLLQEHRAELLSGNGLLLRFTDDEVRTVLRATRTYALILHDGLHPDTLRSGLERDRLIDQLWIEIEHRPDLERVFPSEREDLNRGDVPIFHTRPDSLDVWNSPGKRIAGFLDESGLQRIKTCLAQFGEEDLQKQLWIIRSSLAVLTTAHQHTETGHESLKEPQTVPGREQFIDGARAVAERLEALALRSEGEVTWIGLTLNNDLQPLGVDLYGGLTGVALFLAYVSEISGEVRYRELARAALNSLRRQIEEMPVPMTFIGGFGGWGGIIYALTHLGVLWDEAELLDEAEAHAKRLTEFIEKDENLDIIAGAAGCIGALLSLYRIRPTAETLAVAVQCGDHLLNKAQPMERGLAWITLGEDSKPLAGFSHGAAGIAWALLELAAVSGEERFHAAARKAVEFEESLFSPEEGNWQDLRDPAMFGREDDGTPQFMSAWCHGAPGIGLGRLRTLKYLDSPMIRAEIKTAINTTIKHGFGGGHCLCHGDLGNLELLLQARDILNEHKWQPEIERLSAHILASIEQHGWCCGVPMEVETPGLMTGLAGIGYGLLRLAEPQQVPSVLVLEAPGRIDD